jgi:hypothetical protein
MKTLKFEDGEVAQISQFGDGLDGTLVRVIGISTVSPIGDAFFIVKKVDDTLFYTDFGPRTAMVITQHCLNHV